MTRVLGSIVVLLAALASVADASRVHMPMGFYIRQTELIVIADTQMGGERGHDLVLSISEVVRGDPAWAGQAVVLTSMLRSTADAGVPTPTKGLAVLLRPDWQATKRWPVLEVYQKPHEIEALRLLVKIDQKLGERQRLIALRDVFTEGNPVCREQLFADFRDMKDPDNFDLMTDFYPSLDSANQRTLVDLLGQIGDLRAVPTLIRAMSSPDEQLSATAALRLSSTFPGAPGITEAFEKALDREHLRRTAARYLLRRRDDPELKATAEPEKTLWQQAESLRSSGDAKAAKALYLIVIEDKNESDYTRRTAAARIVHRGSAAEKDRIRKALLPLLAKDAETNNYIFAFQAARILRALQHPDCCDPMLRLLDWSSFTYQPSVREATMGIRELGSVARRAAVIHLIDRLESAGDRRAQGENSVQHLLGLVWLGNENDFRDAELAMPARYRRTWQALGPLLPLDRHEDEGEFLLKLLRSGPPLPRDASDWILFRLGDLRDRRAIDQLVCCLVEEPDWGLNRSACEALEKIGGPKVETELATLLTHEEHNRVRRHAIGTLFKLQGRRSLATTRRMLSEEDFGLKWMACSNLAQIGTPDDLNLLLPLCDYWTADRKTHYQATLAVAVIRQRYGYDIHGPVKKAPADRGN
jgi:HEAT repeat protein